MTSNTTSGENGKIDTSAVHAPTATRTLQKPSGTALVPALISALWHWCLLTLISPRDEASPHQTHWTIAFFISAAISCATIYDQVEYFAGVNMDGIRYRKALVTLGAVNVSVLYIGLATVLLDYAGLTDQVIMILCLAAFLLALAVVSWAVIILS